MIGSIVEACEPKCSKSGCDNKRASGSIVICINQVVHHIAAHHIAVNHQEVLLKVV